MDKQYRHLSAEERAVVRVEPRKGVSLRAIARELGRNVSTISREVHRNPPAEELAAAKEMLAYDATAEAGLSAASSALRLPAQT